MGEDARAGARASEQFLQSLPALAKVKAMASAAFLRGYMAGIDGRRVQIPSEHKALAMYLQAGEATIMKKAYIFAYNRIKKAGLDAKIVGIIHDEIQMDCSKEDAEAAGRIVIQAIVDAGLFYKLRCPLAGDMHIGLTWAETH
jgi:DNA polymerase I-like protein with 3'-5' exonuclease and polymerase domains